MPGLTAGALSVFVRSIRERYLSQCWTLRCFYQSDRTVTESSGVLQQSGPMPADALIGPAGLETKEARISAALGAPLWGPTLGARLTEF